ncbi:unnamed protein product [Urochloa humidicola]
MEESAVAATVATPNHSARAPRIRAAPVRVVARICPSGGSRGSFQVAARVPDAADSSSASVSFIPINKKAAPAAAGAPTSRKDCEYKLDSCYLKDDSCSQIFDNEVKHLLDNIFCGDGHSNACVVTCGGTGKTHLMMGSQDHPGLLTMAMEQILHRAKPIRAAVSVSSYQVLQDNHVFDLLETKDSEVDVLEDADGRIHLKGLSRVDIKSIEEFSDLCCDDSYKLKQSTKASNQIQTKEHRGFVIYISKSDQPGREGSVAKINFLDLAGYGDTKQKNCGGGFAPTNSNKSLYAVMNVVQALNSNQSFIPYRPYKVTRILQDSLCKTSGAVLICCLDEVSCQDALSTVTLASRSSQAVNGQLYNLSVTTRSCSKSNVNLAASSKKLSRSMLPSIQQRSSVLQKHGRTQFSNSAVKATQTPTANKRSEVTVRSAKKPVSSVSASINMKYSGAESILSGRSEVTVRSAKKPVSSVSASINMKYSGAKSILSGRRLFSPITNSSKEDKIHVFPTVVEKAEDAQSSVGMEIQSSSPVEACDETEKAAAVRQDAQSSVGMEIQSSSPVEACDETEKAAAVVSSEMQEVVVPCSVKELVSVDMQEKDHSSSDLHADNSYIDLGMTCSSDLADEFAEKTPVCATASPKLSDRLKEISNSLKLLSTRPVNVKKPKTDTVCAQLFNTDVTEPKTPAGIKKSLAKDCLTILNSATKEELKSLKGIGEKRANLILELREESPEPFKTIDDLRTIVRMRKTEITKLLSGMIQDS